MSEMFLSEVGVNELMDAYPDTVQELREGVNDFAYHTCLSQSWWVFFSFSSTLVRDCWKMVNTHREREGEGG